MYDMFRGASSFNWNISQWNVSGVTNMTEVFYFATSFNGDLSTWDVSKVITAYYMFSDAQSFNGNLSNWNVSSITNTRSMFSYATSFNADLSSWNVRSYFVPLGRKTPSECLELNESVDSKGEIRDTKRIGRRVCWSRNTKNKANSVIVYLLEDGKIRSCHTRKKHRAIVSKGLWRREETLSVKHGVRG